MAGGLGRALEPVIAALIAELLENGAVALASGAAQLDPVEVHIAADECRRDGDRLLLQPEQSL